MSVVVNFGAYRKRGTLQSIRELFLLAARGRIAGLRFEAQLTDGSSKRGATGTLSESESPAADSALISLPVRQFKR